MEHNETSIVLFGVKISEPITSLTDLLVSAVCLYAYLKLTKSKTNSPVVKLFFYYFLTMAISWLLKDQNLTSVLMGVSTVEQLHQNIAVLNNSSFSSDELSDIKKILE